MELFQQYSGSKLTLEVLLLLILVVFTSAIVLFLVQTGIVSVKGEHADVPILNTEFIPLQREGFLAVKEFQFCSYVDVDFRCSIPRQDYAAGDDVFFRYAIESSVAEGQIMVVKNYRLRSPAGDIILEADERNNVYVQEPSSSKTELITYKDSFFLGGALTPGEYTLELIVENPFIAKTVRTTYLLEVTG